MIKIFVWKKNGDGVKRLLYLSPDTTITMKIRNPLVNDQGTFSYPLHLNYEKNNHIFDFPADGEGEVKKFAFEMWVGSDFFFEGDVEIIDAYGIEVYLKSGNSSVSNILQNSYMDEAINGHSWGENAVPANDIVATEQGFYPDYNFVAFPVRYDDGTFNMPSSGFFQLFQFQGSPFCPGVFVYYLINRIINALGYVKRTDTIHSIPDIDKLFIWCARLGSDYSEYKSWLPHVSTLDFLNSIRDKFSINIYFSPVNRFCDVLLTQDAFSIEPRQWDSKQILTTDGESYNKKTILLKHSGSGDMYLSSDRVSVNPTFIFNDKNELPDRNYYPEEGDNIFEKRPKTPEVIARVGSAEPFAYYKNALVSQRSQYSFNIYLSQESVATNTYAFVKEVPEGSAIEVPNALSGIGVKNEICRFRFKSTDFNSMGGLIFHQRIAVGVHAKVDSNIADLVIEAGFYTPSSSDIIASNRITISNTTYELFFLYLNLSRSINYTSSFDFTKFQIRIYKESDYENYITLKFGGDDFTTVPSYMLIDPDFFDWREVSLAASKFGEKSSPDITIESAGGLLNNEYDYSLKFRQIPIVEDSPDLTQEKFYYSFYRGPQKITLNVMQLEYDLMIPFASFDNVGLDGEPYDIEPGYPAPQSTLRWNGEKGIVNRCMKDYVYRRQHAWRRVRKKLNLSVLDISHTPLYHPIIIQSQLYIISELSVPIHVTKGIGETTAELFTI